MSNWGSDKPKPKSWASGLRLMSRDKSGTNQEAPSSSNPSEEKEFRFLMGQSFMGGGLDGLMGESSSSSNGSGKRNRDLPQDEESQEAVDNMLSNILKKTKTELKHLNPTLLESQSEKSTSSINPHNQQWQNQYQPHPYYPSVNMAYQPPPPPPPPPHHSPPFIDVSRPPPPLPGAAFPLIDLTKPPPNFTPGPAEPAPNASDSTSPKTATPAEPTEKIERKWGNILKPNDSSSSIASRTSESQSVSTPPPGSVSPSLSESSKSRDQAASTTPLRSPTAERMKSEQPTADGVTLHSSGFKDIMSYDIDPVNMTYCGKEFIDIVDIPYHRRSFSSDDDAKTEAVCHLCQLSRLMPQDLALHLDGDKHFKNLRAFIMDKEYEIYTAKLDDPLHVALYPDFNTYMLRRYPSRLEEYFEKSLVVDATTMKTRTEFVLKFKPTKMLLAEKDPQFKAKEEEIKKKKKKDSEPLSECPYCSVMLTLDEIATHACDARDASEVAKEQGSTKRIKVGVPMASMQPHRPGIPTSKRHSDSQAKAKAVVVEEEVLGPLPIPSDAVDVQLKLEMCKEFEKLGQCQYKKKCMFAHSSDELNAFTYRRTKTELCDRGTANAPCLFTCGKAHSKDELAICSKTELCRSFIELKTCQYKNKCQFAHGMRELISPWDYKPLAFGKNNEIRPSSSGGYGGGFSQPQGAGGAHGATSSSTSSSFPAFPFSTAQAQTSSTLVAVQPSGNDGPKTMTTNKSKIKLTLKKS